VFKTPHRHHKYTVQTAICILSSCQNHKKEAFPILSESIFSCNFSKFPAASSICLLPSLAIVYLLLILKSIKNWGGKFLNKYGSRDDAIRIGNIIRDDCIKNNLDTRIIDKQLEDCGIYKEKYESRKK